MKLSLSLLLAGLLAGVSASNVLDLDASNFDSAIGNGKPGLVELCVRRGTSSVIRILLNFCS
jgi:protein disulfide-isomerase A6